MSKDISFEARAYPFEEPKGNQLAFASVTINETFVITGVKVMNGENGPFAAMPSTKDKEGNFKDICFPTNKELRADLNAVVVEAYNTALEKMQDRAEKAPEKASAVGKLNDAKKEAKKQPAKEKADKAKGDDAR